MAIQVGDLHQVIFPTFLKFSDPVIMHICRIQSDINFFLFVGMQQQQGISVSGPRHVTPSMAGKPPLPHRADEGKPTNQQKSKVPVLEKHFVDQLSKEEQEMLNSKFQEAADANKKVHSLLFYLISF